MYLQTSDLTIGLGLRAELLLKLPRSAHSLLHIARPSIELYEAIA